MDSHEQCPVCYAEGWLDGSLHGKFCRDPECPSCPKDQHDDGRMEKKRQIGPSPLAGSGSSQMQSSAMCPQDSQTSKIDGEDVPIGHLRRP